MPKVNASNRFITAKTFAEQVRLVLENYKSPQVLSDQSPLAKPYFLSHLVEQQAPHGLVEWGEVLIAAIDQAAIRVYGGDVPDRHAALVEAVEAEEEGSGRDGRYDFFILELNYFKRIYRPHPRNQADIYNDILYISRATYNRHLNAAIERLAAELLTIIRPTLRLETPFLPVPIVGRDGLRNQILEILYRRRTVSLIGPSGIGKTTLGSYLRVVWSNQRVFWYTFQSGLSDNINSLLFAFGYFLHQAGHSSLWQQMVADSGKVDDLNMAFGLALSDLAEMDETPLLCFDEVDVLYTADLDREDQRHADIKTFLNRLRREAPLLLIGQRTVIEGDAVFEVGTLQVEEVEAWLRQVEVSFTTRNVERLLAYTKGNPRLIGLCISLHKLQANSFTETLDTLPRTPGYGPVWDRVRRHLTSIERRLLQGMAVFRSPAPEDAFGGQMTDDGVTDDSDEDLPSSDSPLTVIREPVISEALDRLFTRNLVYRDGAGGIYLLPMLKDILYQELTIEQRERLHGDAAMMYGIRGEPTEAAYHFWQADRPEEALAIWFPLRRQEAERGNGPAALNIFNEISGNRLSKKLRDNLFFIRGWLKNRLGEPQPALEEFEKIADVEQPDIQLEINQLWGDALNNSGNRDGANERFEVGIERISELIEKLVLLHYSRGVNYRHEKNLSAAQQDVSLAQYYVEMLNGGIQDDLGHFSEALDHYQKALHLAEKSNQMRQVGRVQYNMGIVFAKLEQFEEAFDHFQAAIDVFVAIKNKIQEMYARSNYGSTLALAGNHQAGIEESLKALAFYEQTQSAYWIALNATTLADTYFDMGNFEEAARYARKVIEQEEMQFYPYGLYTMGAVKQAQADLKTAKDLFLQSSQMAESNADRYMQAYAQRALGEVFCELGDTSSGGRSLQQACRLFKKMGISSEVKKSESLMEKYAITP